MQIELPYPPSVNRIWRSFSKGGRVGVYLHPETKAYKEEVTWLLKCKGRPLLGEVGVSIDVWMPDHRKRDIDNLLKVMLDCLTESQVIEDDSLITSIIIMKQGVIKGGKVNLTVNELPKKYPVQVKKRPKGQRLTRKKKGKNDHRVDDTKGQNISS